MDPASYSAICYIPFQMALFDPGFTTCSICGEVLVEGDDRVGTTHFIADTEHPLFPHSDALMHRACFLKWEHRTAFVAAYNAQMGDVHRMGANGTIRERFLFRIGGAIIDKGGAIIDKVAAVGSWLLRRRR